MIAEHLDLEIAHAKRRLYALLLKKPVTHTTEIEDRIAYELQRDPEIRKTLDKSFGEYGGAKESADDH